MPLPSSGAISIDQIYNEAISLNYTGGKDLIGLSNFNGWYPALQTPLPPYEFEKFYSRTASPAFISVTFFNNTVGSLTLQEFQFHVKTYEPGVGADQVTYEQINSGDVVVGAGSNAAVGQITLTGNTAPTIIWPFFRMSSTMLGKTMHIEFNKFDTSTYTVELAPFTGVEVEPFEELPIEDSDNTHPFPYTYNHGQSLSVFELDNPANNIIAFDMIYPSGTPPTSAVPVRWNLFLYIDD